MESLMESEKHFIQVANYSAVSNIKTEWRKVQPIHIILMEKSERNIITKTMSQMDHGNIMTKMAIFIKESFISVAPYAGT